MTISKKNRFIPKCSWGRFINFYMFKVTLGIILGMAVPFSINAFSLSDQELINLANNYSRQAYSLADQNIKNERCFDALSASAYSLEGIPYNLKKYKSRVYAMQSAERASEIIYNLFNYNICSKQNEIKKIYQDLLNYIKEF